MPPVRIRVYGLFLMTRRTYLVLQGMTVVAVSAFVAVAWWWPRPVPVPNPTLLQTVLLSLLDLLPLLWLVFLLGEALETVLVLSRFAAKQQEADRAAEVASSSAPTAG
jgi:hypothetical protein